MPRKNNENNPLQIKLRAKSLPKSVTPKRYYQRLLQHLTEGKPLPPLWDVELSWRNPKTKQGLTKRWRSDDFESAVSDSREGFNMLLHDAIRRRLRSKM
jgi:hypothetical protein